MSITAISISRRIMKDSQLSSLSPSQTHKYIKANNERFSTFGTLTDRVL